MLFGCAIKAHKSQAHKKQAKKTNEGGKKANIYENCFRGGGEENEMQMANNVMQEMRVYDGYLVCLDLAQISPATALEILPATS